jgi:hypothetical protein
MVFIFSKNAVYWSKVFKSKGHFLIGLLALTSASISIQDLKKILKVRDLTVLHEIDNIALGDAEAKLIEKMGPGDLRSRGGSTKYYVYFPYGLFKKELRFEVRDGHVVAMEKRNLQKDDLVSLNIKEKVKVSDLLARWGRPDEVSYNPSQVDSLERYYLYQKYNTVIIGENDKLVGIRVIQDQSKFLPAFNPALPKDHCQY